MNYKYIRVDGRVVGEHTYKAEWVLGRLLKSNEVVHHIDGDKRNNDNSNLIICDRSYHQLIHQREKKLNAGFIPEEVKWCSHHQQYEPIESFNTGCNRCRQANTEYERARRNRRRLDNLPSCVGC